MASLFVFFVLLCVKGSLAEAARRDAEPRGEETVVDGVKAIAFLAAQGIEEHGEVFYHKRSDNVTACLQHPDATSRVIQMCTARTLLEQCSGTDQSFYYNDCQGRTCMAVFSREHTYCLLERSGVALELNSTLGGWLCSLPPGEQAFFEWQTPPYVQAIGDENHFDCLTAMPPNTIIERRVICEGEHPILQHRVIFDSKMFLDRDDREVRCVARQSCGLPTIFAGELACYETLSANDDDDVRELEFADGSEISLEILDAPDAESSALSIKLSNAMIMMSMLFSFSVSFLSLIFIM